METNKTNITADLQEKLEDDFLNLDLIEQGLERLHNIIAKEAELILEEKFDEALKLAEDKMELVDFFEKHKDDVLQVFQNTDEDKERKNKLKDLAQSLLANSSKSMNKIKKAQYINGKMVEIVKKALTDNIVDRKNYSLVGKKKVDNKDSKNIIMDTEV